MELIMTTKSTTTMTTMMAMMAMVMMMTMMFGVGGGSTPEPQCNLQPVVPPSGDLLHYSDVVVLGEVKDKVPEPVDPAPEEQEDGDGEARPAMYRVRMLVYCIYKGQQVPRMIDIWEAGNITENCSDEEMQVGQLYLAFLYKHSPTVHTPAFPYLPDTYRDELDVVCDLNITVPAGDLPAGSKDVTCVNKQPDYDDDNDYYGEGEEDCVKNTPKAGDSTYRIKKPSNLFIGKTEKKEGDGGAGGAGGVSVCLTLLSSALLVAATVVGPLL